MAGHSKWANIQHRKGAQDAKRGKIFTRLIREITIAARMGGEDINSNPRLRAAIDTARASNMANDTIERAIKRGAGGLEGQDVEEIRYEGYGPGGVAIMVDCMTNNRNRTVAEVRHAFTKRGGNLGTDGSVNYLFTKLGQFYFSKDHSEDKIMEVALDAGAQDVQTLEDGTIEVTCAPEDFEAINAAMKKNNLLSEHAAVSMVASVQVEVEGEEAEKLVKLLEMLEDLEDVQNVYSNAEIPAEYLT